MNRMDDISTVPFPRFRTILLAIVGIALTWIAWSSWQEEQARQALFDRGAAAVQRVQAVERWVELGAHGVPQLIAALSAEDEDARRYAAMALGRLGPSAGDAAPSLTGLLGHSADETEMWAIVALEQIGCHLDQAVPEIIRLLADENPEVAKSAGAALTDGSIGEAFARGEEGALRAVAEIAHHPDPDSRRHAVFVLSRMGWLQPTALQAVRRATHDPDASIRELAFKTLVIWDELTVTEAVNGLRDENLTIVGLVTSNVWRLRDHAEAIVPELTPLLERPTGLSDGSAAGYDGIGMLEPWRITAAIETFGPEAKEALPYYLARLDDESGSVRASAIRTLGEISDGDPPVIARIRDQLSSRSQVVCGAAASALREISPDEARMAVPRLGERLSSEDIDERRCAAVALRNLVPEVREAVVHLAGALNDPDASVREAAITALARVPEQVENVLPILIERIRHPVQNGSEISKSGAIRVLSTAGPSASSASPILIETAEAPDEDPHTRAEAVSALGQIGQDDPRACQLILAAMEDPEPQVRSAAARALVEIRCDRANSISALLRALTDPQPFVPATAIAALVRLRADPKLIVPPLLDCLRSQESLVQKCAAVALAELGPDAEAAIPALLICMHDRTIWDANGWVPSQEPSLDEPWSCEAWPMPVLARRALRAIDPQVLDREESRRAENRTP